MPRGLRARVRAGPAVCPQSDSNRHLADFKIAQCGILRSEPYTTSYGIRGLNCSYALALYDDVRRVARLLRAACGLRRSPFTTYQLCKASSVASQ